MKPAELQSEELMISETAVEDTVEIETSAVERWHMVYMLLREIAARPMPDSKCDASGERTGTTQPKPSELDIDSIEQ